MPRKHKEFHAASQYAYYQIYRAHLVAGKYVEVEDGEPFYFCASSDDYETEFQSLLKSMIVSMSENPSLMDMFSFEFDVDDNDVWEVETFGNFKYQTQGVQSEVDGPKFIVRRVEYKTFRAINKSTREEFVLGAYDCQEGILNSFVARKGFKDKFILQHNTKGVQTSIYNSTKNEQWQIIH